NLDRYRIEAALAKIRGRASQAEYMEVASRSALKTLTGLSTLRIPACPSQPLDVEIDSIERLVENVDQVRPEAQMLDAAVAAQEAQLDIEQARYFPDIALALSAGITTAPGRTNIENPFIRDGGNSQ